MTVFVEAISVMVCRKSIDARVGFIGPHDGEAFIHQLESNGLTFITDDKSVNMTMPD